MDKIKSGYFVNKNILAAYLAGLLATIAVMHVYKHAQPALLYLVPFTLIPTILVAWCRGDLASMWDGDNKVIMSYQ